MCVCFCQPRYNNSCCMIVYLDVVITWYSSVFKNKFISWNWGGNSIVPFLFSDHPFCRQKPGSNSVFLLEVHPHHAPPHRHLI